MAEIHAWRVRADCGGAAMSAPARAAAARAAVPCDAIDVVRYDQTPTLSAAERAALAVVATRQGCQAGTVRVALARLTTPSADVLDAIGSIPRTARRPSPPCGAPCTSARSPSGAGPATRGWRPSAPSGGVAAAGTTCSPACTCSAASPTSARAAPPAPCRASPRRSSGTGRWRKPSGRCATSCAAGAGRLGGAVRLLPGPVSGLLLLARSPHLAEVTPAVLQAALDGARTTHEATRLHTVARALVGLGVVPHLPASTRPPQPLARRGGPGGGRRARLGGVGTPLARHRHPGARGARRIPTTRSCASGAGWRGRTRR